MSKDTLTTGAIAEYCGVNFRTVIRWIERGHLKSYKLPGRGDNRVCKDDFIAFLQENGMPVPDELQVNLRRVLVVDDDERMAKAIERVLRRAKFDVRIANSGFEAGSLLVSFAPRIMTLDLSMPGIDGFQLLEQLRSQYVKPLHVVVISALDEEQLERARRAGANATLSKPFENRDLLELVKSAG